MTTIAQPNLETIEVVIPPGPEQKATLTRLEQESTQIEALIAKIRDGIALLKEYRSALISAVVTGKIDVREEVP